MFQGVDVTDAVIADVQIAATLLAATLLDIKDQAMKLGVLGPTAATGKLLETRSLPPSSTATEPGRLAAFRPIVFLPNAHL